MKKYVRPWWVGCKKGRRAPHSMCKWRRMTTMAWSGALRVSNLVFYAQSTITVASGRNPLRVSNLVFYTQSTVRVILGRNKGPAPQKKIYIKNNYFIFLFFRFTDLSEVCTRTKSTCGPFRTITTLSNTAQTRPTSEYLTVRVSTLEIQIWEHPCLPGSHGVTLYRLFTAHPSIFSYPLITVIASLPSRKLVLKLWLCFGELF